MKNTIQSILFLGALLFALITTAQQPPDFNAKKAAGLITYDIEKVTKKLKPEGEDTKKSIATAIGEYNMQIYQLTDTHATALKELDDYFDRQVQLAMQQRDRSQMDGVKSKISQIIPPIRKEVVKHEQVLNAAMESALGAKQYDKWLKYQKNQKPPTPQMMGG